jgi:hypothetical protein
MGLSSAASQTVKTATGRIAGTARSDFRLSERDDSIRELRMYQLRRIRSCQGPLKPAPSGMEHYAGTLTGLIILLMEMAGDLRLRLF